MACIGSAGGPRARRYRGVTSGQECGAGVGLCCALGCGEQGPCCCLLLSFLFHFPSRSPLCWRRERSFPASQKAFCSAKPGQRPGIPRGGSSCLVCAAYRLAPEPGQWYWAQGSAVPALQVPGSTTPLRLGLTVQDKSVLGRLCVWCRSGALQALRPPPRSTLGLFPLV